MLLRDLWKSDYSFVLKNFLISTKCNKNYIKSAYILLILPFSYKRKIQKKIFVKILFSLNYVVETVLK